MNHTKAYIDTLYRILDCDRLDIAKELAADALGEDVDEFLDDYDLDELEFFNDNEEVY